MLTLLLSLCSSSPSISPGDAPQWGGFRGNNGSGVSSAKKLPDALDPEENLIWRVEVPTGYSSPCVAGKDLYLTASEGAKLWTLALDAYSGEERWRAELDFDGKRPGANSPAAPTPVTDGERVYALFHHFGLVVYDREGKELWKKPIGPFNIPHGMAASPVLFGENLLLQVDQDTGSYLVAYDRKTGAERWKVDRPGVTHGYATPAVWQPAGGAPELVVSSAFQIAGFSLENGSKLWWVDGAAWQTKSVPVFEGALCVVNSFMPGPAEMGMPNFTGSYAEMVAEHDANEDGKVTRDEWADQRVQMIWFILDLDGDEALGEKDWEYALSTGSANGGLFAIELGGKGDLGQKIKWKVEDRRGLSDVTSPLLLDGTLFLVKEGGLVTSIDAGSGKVVKQERLGEPDDYYASPVAGDGKVYLASLSGQLAVISAQREWQPLSVHRIDEEVWSTPALTERQVLIRSQKALYCFESPEDG